MNEPVAETEFCCLTGTGRGAIATLALRGAEAAEMMRCHFHPARGQFSMQANRIRFGSWNYSHSHAAGETMVVVAVADDEIEIHCHGGPAVVESLSRDFSALGAKRRSSQEWLGGTDQLTQECLMAVSQAQTKRSVGLAMDQLRGALREAIDEIVALIQTGDTESAREELHILSDRFQAGRKITSPIEVVIAGPPNVGKSSLLNAILGYERAITLDQPGTTRDVLSAQTSIDGWVFQFMDTAGIRNNAAPVERTGIQFAHERISQSDLVLVVIDGVIGLTKEHRDVIRSATQSLVVWNKVDLQKPDSAALKEVHDLAAPLIQTSSLSGEGLDNLLHKVVELSFPNPLMSGQAIPFTKRQYDLLCAAQSASDAQVMQLHLHQLIQGCLSS